MNIVLIVNDTLRADHLGCYGYFRSTSPTMDRLAEEGVLFEDFYASGINTGTAFTGIHTGLYPIHHKVYSVAPSDLILDDIPTLAETLRDSGYTTAAFDNLAFCRSWSQDPVHFHKGFEHYIGDVWSAKYTKDDWACSEARQGEWYNARMIPWIENHTDEKFFIFVHYWDVHQPYSQPEAYRKLFRHKKGDLSDLQVKQAKAGYSYVQGWGAVGQMYEDYGFVPGKVPPGKVPRREASIDLYDGSIAYVDRCIQDVVDTLARKGILEDTLIVVSSDHGELLGEHGVYIHSTLYESNIRVPLIMRYPAALPQGKRIQGLAGHVDILPTVLDLAGVKDRPDSDGLSLLLLLDGGKPREELVSENAGGVRALRRGDYKFIYVYQDGGAELYNVKADPMELMNLVEAEKEKAGILKQGLESWAEVMLGETAEDPIQYVVKNYDYRKVTERFPMDRYGGGFVYQDIDKPDWSG